MVPCCYAIVAVIDAVNLGHDGIYLANKAQRLNRQHTTQHTCGEAVHILFTTLQMT